MLGETNGVDIEAQIRANREHKGKIASLEEKVLQVELNSLTKLEDYRRALEGDMELHKARARTTLARLELKFKQDQQREVEADLIELHKQMSQVDKEIEEVGEQLKAYRSLDPKLLAEFRSLKDDLECQDLIIQIGENNAS